MSPKDREDLRTLDPEARREAVRRWMDEQARLGAFVKGVPGGTQDIRLALDRARMRVRITDTAGRALPGAFLRAAGWRGAPGPQAGAAAADSTAKWSHRLQADTHGICTILTEAATTWHLTADVRGGAPTEQWLTLADDVRDTDVTLTVSPAPATPR